MVRPRRAPTEGGGLHGVFGVLAGAKADSERPGLGAFDKAARGVGRGRGAGPSHIGSSHTEQGFDVRAEPGSGANGVATDLLLSRSIASRVWSPSWPSRETVCPYCSIACRLASDIDSDCDG